MAAAAPARAAGDTWVLPWPNAAAACSAGSAPVATEPLNTSVPRSHGTPMPTVLAVAASPSGPSFDPREANAVLQDWAKSWCSWAVAPSGRAGAVLIGGAPRGGHPFGHGTTVLGLAWPLSSTPSAVIVLNVDPGAVRRVSARSSSPPSGPLATASTDP